jgi:hypothetical protein
MALQSLEASTAAEVSNVESTSAKSKLQQEVRVAKFGETGAKDSIVKYKFNSSSTIISSIGGLVVLEDLAIIERIQLLCQGPVLLTESIFERPLFCVFAFDIEVYTLSIRRLCLRW